MPAPNLRGTDVGGKLKEAGSKHWKNPKLGANRTTVILILLLFSAPSV
jgi:hypothetical protein